MRGFRGLRASGVAVAVSFAVGMSGCASTGSLGTAVEKVPGVSSLTEQSTWVPTVDPKGLNRARYERDYAECKAFADADPTTQAAPAVKKKAKKWGLGTAAMIGASTVLTGGAAALPYMVGMVAVAGGAGAASGGIMAKQQADVQYRTIVSSCLSGRGYTVLN